MSKLKLKGWVDGIVGTRSKAEIASANWYAVKVVPDMVSGTLVIGEKAFTESEVRSMLQEIKEMSDRMKGTPQSVRARLLNVAALHGIVLDPA